MSHWCHIMHRHMSPNYYELHEFGIADIAEKWAIVLVGLIVTLECGLATNSTIIWLFSSVRSYVYLVGSLLLQFSSHTLHLNGNSPVWICS